MNPMIKMAYQKYVFVNNQCLDICLKYFVKNPYTTQICNDQSCSYCLIVFCVLENHNVTKYFAN